jgi:hypothetical protein
MQLSPVFRDIGVLREIHKTQCSIGGGFLGPEIVVPITGGKDELFLADNDVGVTILYDVAIALSAVRVYRALLAWIRKTRAKALESKNPAIPRINNVYPIRRHALVDNHSGSMEDAFCGHRIARRFPVIELPVYFQEP